MQENELPMPGPVVEAHARRLFTARKHGTRTDLVTSLVPHITAPDARRIADAGFALWGQPACGIKLGYTSAAMRAQMGISQPNFGRLTPDMDFGKGIATPLVHPRAEPEVALRTSRDVTSRADWSGDPLRILDAVFPALEIVDTRYHDYVFRYEDNVADNSSAAGYVLGVPRAPGVLTGDGFDVDFAISAQQSLGGHSSAALGSPLNALAWLLETLEATGEMLPAGSIILTGGLTAAPLLEKGQPVTARFAGLGAVSFTWQGGQRPAQDDQNTGE